MGNVSFEMFLIPTYLGQSTIHGFGVFTACGIEPGICIWEFVEGVDLRLSSKDLDALPANLRPTISSYCYREASGMYVLCGDNAKFMNHSTQPSCDDDGIVTMVRTRLPANAELTCDYRRFDHDTINGRGEWFTEEPADVLEH